MHTKCDHCLEDLVPGFDQVILRGLSNEAEPELWLHACCAITVLQRTPMEKCCETHWLESK